VSPRGGFEPLPPGLRGWLGRALQLDARNSFPSAIEARAELDKVLGDSDYMASPASLDAFLVRFQAAQRPRVATAPVAPSPAAPVIIAPPPAPPVAKIPVAPPPSKPVAAAPVYEAPQAETSRAPMYVAPPETPRAAPEYVTPRAETPRATPAPPPIQLPFATAPSSSAPVHHPSFDLQPLASSVAGSRPPLFSSSTASTSRAPVFEPERGDEAAEAPRSRSRQMLLAVAAVALVAVGVGATLASRGTFTSKPVVSATGTLVITTNPVGAEAVVDGQPKGKTPLTLSLPAGTHMVELRGGGEPRTIPVTIAAGQQIAQYIDLPTAPSAVGQLQVRSEPAGARVVVDGTPRGTSPALVTNLSPGEHTVVVEGDLGSVKQTVTVESGMTAALVVPLTAPASGPVSGWVAVSGAMNVQVFEQGRLLGSSETDRIMVSAGRHEFEFVNDDLGFRIARTVQVPAGKVASVSLERPKGTLSLNAVPWAEVWIDGEKVGDTPIGNLELPIGAHDVVFRHPELGERHQTALVTLKNPTRLSVDLRKK
jgi:hypothetical protein